MRTQFTPPQLDAMNRAKHVRGPRTRASQPTLGKAPSPPLPPLQKKRPAAALKKSPQAVRPAPVTGIHVNFADGTSRVFPDEAEANAATAGKTIEKHHGAWHEVAAKAPDPLPATAPKKKADKN